MTQLLILARNQTHRHEIFEIVIKSATNIIIWFHNSAHWISRLFVLFNLNTQGIKFTERLQFVIYHIVSNLYTSNMSIHQYLILYQWRNKAVCPQHAPAHPTALESEQFWGDRHVCVFGPPSRHWEKAFLRRYLLYNIWRYKTQLCLRWKTIGVKIVWGCNNII